MTQAGVLDGPNSFLRTTDGKPLPLTDEVLTPKTKLPLGNVRTKRE